MTNQELLEILGDIKSEYILQAQELRSGRQKTTVFRLNRKRTLLIAAAISLLLLLAGCAIVYAAIIYGSPAEMIAGLYGEHSGFRKALPAEGTDPDKPGSSWMVPGYEKQPIEETVAQELEKWVSPVGQSIASDGYRLTVDAFLYDSATQSGLMTMLLEHQNPLTEEELGVDYNGRICRLHGNLLNFNQYGWPYLIPEKTTDTQLAFTFYFQLDQRRGDSLIVSFADFAENERIQNLKALRSEQIPVIRERLMQELTVEEAAARCMQELGFSGYTGEYDDYYYLAANEFDAAHAAENTTESGDELTQILERIKAELSPEEAIGQVKAQWGEALFEETFRGREQTEIAESAYAILAERSYERTHTENKVYVSLPETLMLPNRSFGNGDVLVNSLCIRVNSDKFAGAGGSPDTVILHYRDGSSFVVRNGETDNTLFGKGTENGNVLYMLNSAVNIDNIHSVEIVGVRAGSDMTADNE